MVTSSFLSLALSFGLLGLRAVASPVAPGTVTTLQPIREDDLLAGTLKLNDFHRRAIVDSMNNAIELLPINEDNLTPSHLRKRADDLSRLDLKEEVRMIYGGVCSKSQIYMANMTLYQPDADHPLIMMEKFDGLLNDASCSSGSVNLSFKTKAAMDYAIKAWDWVNEATSDHFFLIANHKNCGQDAQRTPYKVVKVKYDQNTFTTVLTTESISWDSLASDFDINLGSAALPSRLRKRGVNGADITKRGFWDIFTSFDFSKSVYWDLSVGDESRRRTLADPFHEWKRLQVTCAGCFLAGGIEISGYIKVESFSVKELQFAAKPRNLRAKVEVETVIQSGIPKGAFSLEQTLFELGIPGMSIPGIFTLGPSLQYQVGFSLATSGVANFTVGVAAQVPNGAALLGDILNSENSGASGFEGSTIDPIFNLNNIAVTAAASVYAQPVVAFGVKVLTKFGAECALELKLPFVNVNLQAGYNQNGFCPEKSKTITNGLRSTSGANIELWFKAAKFSGLPSWFPNFDRKLWGVRWPFFDLCFPIGEEHASPIVPKRPTGMLPDLGLPGIGPVLLDESNVMPPIAARV
ncbi:hypothetical protein H072_825 [Dactylellina haptotyla CBS 200.50]|uniref:Uncharacterized protein n=1 Tax=Dactylellina haptotyla (strain CBS 200.50) TaxID=1284197 RepID=S8AQN9_DACHA|nr:hypothetical protein H072_825 [Dactylellina haptotyla CBS 200.50]